MNYSSLLAAGAFPLICILDYAVSRYLNRDEATERDSANSLVVLSGMLAALAILIPLGAILLPEKHFAWPAWLLVGALSAGVLCIFGTIYSMISLQNKKAFAPNASPYIPSWINATWFALFVLAFSSVVVKALPTVNEGNADSAKGTAQVRFVVARDLPELGASRQEIGTKWGTPTQPNDSELVYRTKDGAIVFCLDLKGVTQSITETKESDANALRAYCK